MPLDLPGDSEMRRNALVVGVLVLLTVLIFYINVQHPYEFRPSTLITLCAYVIAGTISYLGVRGTLAHRFLLTAAVPVISVIIDELIRGSDPSYPYIRIIYLVPLILLFALGTLLGFLAERFWKRRDAKNDVSQP
jgi:hypothetical protein